MLLPWKVWRRYKPLLFVFSMVAITISLFTLMNYDGAQNEFPVLLTSRNKVPEEWESQNQYSTKLYQSQFEISESFISHPLVYDYDPRLTNSVYMNHIISHAESLDTLEVPFSWYDWADLTVLNEFITLPPEDKPTCEYVCTRVLSKSAMKELEQKIKRTYKTKKRQATSKPAKRMRKGTMACSKYCETDTSRGQPGFKIFDLQSKGKANVKTLHSSSYLFSRAPLPYSIVFTTRDGNVQVAVQQGEDKGQNMVANGLLDEFIKQKSLIFNTSDIVKEFESIIPPNTTVTDHPYRVELTHDMFQFDAPAYLETSVANTPNQRAYHQSVSDSLRTQDEALVKHLHEASISNEPMINGAHFDARFFNGGSFTLEQRQQMLSRLVSTWFTMCANIGVHTWIAHGALLSHTYNGLSFPWDDDADVQLPLKDLMKLAELYNSSIIVEDPHVGYGRYFLDITESITHRTRGNGLNRIDGRFIDVNSGYFLDITGLSVSSTIIPRRFSDLYSTLNTTSTGVKHEDPNVIIDGYYAKLTMAEVQNLSEQSPEFRKGLKELTTSRRKVSNGLTVGKSHEEMFDINWRLQLYNCRNNHFVHLDQVSPLRLTYHDKIPMYLPDGVDQVLNPEYKAQPILSIDFLGYTYIPQLRLWIPSKDIRKLVTEESINQLKEEDIMKLLDDDSILEKFVRTWDATILHEKESFLLRSDLPNKEELLELLMKERHWLPLWSDPFMDKMSSKSNPNGDNHDVIRKLMKEQLHREYTKKVDYAMDGRVLSVDYNTLTDSLKDVLIDLQRTGIDVDLDVKISMLERKINEAGIPMGRLMIAQWKRDLAKLRGLKESYAPFVV